MPKPPVYRASDIEDVFRAGDPGERVRCLRRLAPSGALPFELVLEIAAQGGVRMWRASYDAGFPSGYLGLSGALELMPFLPERDRALALLQAVGAAAGEGLETPPSFAGWPWSHSLGHEATMDDLDNSLAERALSKFHGRLVPFLNEETRRKYGHRYLYSRSVLDFAHGGQRHILVGRGLRLAERLGWRNSEQSLLALSHYFLHAPQDYQAAERLQGWLDRLGKDIPGDNRKRKPALPAEEAEDLERAVLAGEEATALLDRILDVWMKGYALEAITEVFLLAAARFLRAGVAEAAAARTTLFLDSSLAAFPWLRGHDGMVQVLMCGQRVAALGSPPASAEEPAAAGSRQALVAAIERGDRRQAAREAVALAGSGAALGEWLAGAAARRDATAEDVGMLGVAPVLLTRFGRSASARKDELVAALAAFLARPAQHTLARAWGA